MWLIVRPVEIFLYKIKQILSKDFLFIYPPIHKRLLSGIENVIMIATIKPGLSFWFQEKINENMYMEYVCIYYQPTYIYIYTKY